MSGSENTEIRLRCVGTFLKSVEPAAVSQDVVSIFLSNCDHILGVFAARSTGCVRKEEAFPASQHNINNWAHWMAFTNLQLGNLVFKIPIIDVSDETCWRRMSDARSGDKAGEHALQVRRFQNSAKRKTIVIESNT